MNTNARSRSVSTVARRLCAAAAMATLLVVPGQVWASPSEEAPRTDERVNPRVYLARTATTFAPVPGAVAWPKQNLAHSQDFGSVEAPGAGRHDGAPECETKDTTALDSSTHGAVQARWCVDPTVVEGSARAVR